MYICQECLQPGDKPSFFPVSVGPCETCGKRKPCYEVRLQERTAQQPATDYVTQLLATAQEHGNTDVTVKRYKDRWEVMVTRWSFMKGPEVITSNRCEDLAAACREVLGRL